MKSSNHERETTSNQKDFLEFFVRLDTTANRLINCIQVFYTTASALNKAGTQVSESVDALYGAIDLLECISDDFRADVKQQEIVQV